MVERSDGKPPSFRSVRSLDIPTSPTPQQRHAGLRQHSADAVSAQQQHRSLESQRSYELPSRRSYELPSGRSIDLPTRHSYDIGSLDMHASPHSSTGIASVQRMDSSRPASESPGRRHSSHRSHSRADRGADLASLRDDPAFQALGTAQPRRPPAP